MSKVVFLDRDGTIVEDPGYPRDPQKVKWTPHAVEGLKRMVEKGYQLYIVSNQSGVGSGKILDTEFWAVHGRVVELLQGHGIEIEEFAYCLHRNDEGCQCRKPNTDLVHKFWGDKEIDFGGSFVVGDKACDLDLGKNLGTQSVLVRTGKGRDTESRYVSEVFGVFDDLLGVAESLPTLSTPG